MTTFMLKAKKLENIFISTYFFSALSFSCLWLTSGVDPLYWPRSRASGGGKWKRLWTFSYLGRRGPGASGGSRVPSTTSLISWWSRDLASRGQSHLGFDFRAPLGSNLSGWFGALARKQLRRLPHSVGLPVVLRLSPKKNNELSKPGFIGRFSGKWRVVDLPEIWGFWRFNLEFWAHMWRSRTDASRQKNHDAFFFYLCADVRLRELTHVL